jgi:hypothetical protein
MRRLRKYLVFWIIILGAFTPFAAPIGAWARSALMPVLAPVIAPAPIASSGDPEESLALLLEDHFDMVDVVNIDHGLNDGGDPVLTIQLIITSPVGSSIYERLLAESLQGLDEIKTGEEKYYLIEMLYGNWLIGRLQCESTEYQGGAIDPSLCDYSDVSPASYVGNDVRWPGRPADASISSE